jgi:hypothetical protein
MRGVYLCNEWRKPSVCAFVSATCSLHVRPAESQLINRCQRKERELDASKIAQMAAGFTSGGLAQLNTRARWLKTYTCLTDLVTGQFTVERLIANNLLDRPENPMLFHAGDQRGAFHT